MVFHRGGRILEIVRVRRIHTGATWPSTNKCPNNFREIYPPVLGSVLSTKIMVGKNMDKKSVVETLN
jgi:hypothetical protein